MVKKCRNRFNRFKPNVQMKKIRVNFDSLWKENNNLHQDKCGTAKESFRRQHFGK